MTKYLIALVAFVSIILAGSLSTYAQSNPLGPACQGQAAGSSLCQPPGVDPVTGTDNIFIKIAQAIVYITGIASVLMVILGGFAYVTSSGDPQKISGAKNTILYALVGLAVAISAQVIISFVLSNVG